MNLENQCCGNNNCHYVENEYGINVTTLAHHPEPLLVYQAAELVPSEMRKPGTKITFWTYEGWQTWQFFSMDVRQWILPEYWKLENGTLEDNEVTTRKIDDEAVTSDKLANSSVISSKIRNGAVTTEKLADNAVKTDKINDGAVTTIKLADNAVTTDKIKDKAITPAKISSDLRNYLTKDLQNQIDSIQIGGWAISNEFGDDEHIGVSQKTITGALNRIWAKLEDITGEVLTGFSMTVTPNYFISEEACPVHITAHTVETNGIFEKLTFYANGIQIASAENVDYFEFDTDISETTVFKCEAQILGIEYERQEIVTHYNSFWLGAGNTYADIMDVSHVIPITNGMRGNYNLQVSQYDHIIIVVGDSLRSGFMRADMNGVEIPLTESSATVDGKLYRVFTSVNTYNAGTYNIDINS